MAIRYKHSDVYSMYFCTFTCCNWIQLFEITNAYDLVYNWFKVLKDKYSCDVAQSCTAAQGLARLGDLGSAPLAQTTRHHQNGQEPLLETLENFKIIIFT